MTVNGGNITWSQILYQDKQGLMCMVEEDLMFVPIHQTTFNKRVQQGPRIQERQRIQASGALQDDV